FPDGDPVTDTAVKYVDFCWPLSGVHTIGDSTREFHSFNEALDAMMYCGVSAHVFFDVDPGIYEEQLNIGEILDASATRTVTFRSATGDSSDIVLRYTPGYFEPKHTLLLDGTDHIRFENISFEID